MQSATRDQIREFIIENFLFGQTAKFTDDQSFLESGLIDSTGMLELVGFIESRFDIKVADAELVPEVLDSVNNVVRFIERKSKLGTGGGAAT